MAFADPNLQIPDRYDRSGEVPAGEVVVADDDESYDLPVVDMARLLDPEHREAEVAWLCSACRSWGFFQLINHGVDEAVIQKMKDNTVHFFELPLEDKNAVAVCPDGGIEGFGHHFRTSADKLDWAENLIVETQPIERRKLEFWPINDTPGLQISKDGRWHPVRPQTSAFVINVGEILEVLTNGHYKSVFHRVVVDTERGRDTIVVFQDACINGVVKPLLELGEARYHAIDRLEYSKGHATEIFSRGERFVDILKK
ncbi:Os09g0353400 [Oryza sativa Japonica Group]|nr:Os09g0353400 [Oryza sativa Japonica Group]|eukprot:NP_001062960.2 Os09g0353400 [Oryza sativa Japonica Group]